MKQTGYALGGPLEGAGPVGCAVAGGSVVANYGGAEISEAAQSVVAAGDVEQRSGRCGVGKRGRDAGGVPGQGVDGADDRGGNAGAAEDVPAGTAYAAVAVVNRDPGVGVGDCGDIGHGPARARFVLL